MWVVATAAIKWLARIIRIGFTLERMALSCSPGRHMWFGQNLIMTCHTERIDILNNLVSIVTGMGIMADKTHVRIDGPMLELILLKLLNYIYMAIFAQ